MISIISYSFFEEKYSIIVRLSFFFLKILDNNYIL